MPGVVCVRPSILTCTYACAILGFPALLYPHFYHKLSCVKSMCARTNDDSHFETKNKNKFLAVDHSAH